MKARSISPINGALENVFFRITLIGINNINKKSVSANQNQ